MQKKKYISRFLVIVLIVIAILSGYFIMNKKKNNCIKDVQGNLIIATFSIKEKGNILLYNLDNKKETSIVKDSSVGVSGDVSKDGCKAAYANAFSDYDSWQIYMHKIGQKNKNDKKVTDDDNGKASPRIGQDNLVYYLTGDTSGIMEIGRLDPESKSVDLIDDKSSDCKADAMDIKDGKIIMSSTRNSVYEKQWEQNEGEDKPITHSIYEMDSDGGNLKKIFDFQASSVESISYTPDGTEVIISGSDINGNSGEGIYKLALGTDDLTLLLNEELLSEYGNSEVNRFSNPNLAKMSLDNETLYFAGACTDEEQVKIQEIDCYPSAIFSYNINTKEIKKIYEPKDASFIFDLNIKY